LLKRGETVDELRPPFTPALSFIHQVATFAAIGTAPVAAMFARPIYCW